MFTRVCILTFPDGAQIKATLTADSPHIDVPIAWGGAVERLQDYILNGDDAVLMALMRAQAKQLGASLLASTEGEYERFAE